MNESFATSRANLVRVLVALFLVAVYVRLFIGGDYTYSDESLYLALPYSFTLGHRPFVDEHALYQGFAFLLALPFRLYCLLTGSQTGIALFARHLYFAYALFACRALFLGLRWVVDRGAATLISLLPLVFIGYGVPCLSYNTMAELGLASGLGLLMSAAWSERAAREFFFGTLLVSSAAFVHPVVSPSLPFVLLLSWAATYLRERDRGRAKACAKGAFVAIGCVALLATGILIRYGARALYEDWTFQRSEKAHVTNVASLLRMPLDVLTAGNTHSSALLLFLSLLVLALSRGWARVVPALLAVFFSYRIVHLVPYTSPAGHSLIASLALVGALPAAYFLVKKHREKYPLILALWLPSCLAGLSLEWVGGPLWGMCLMLVPAASGSIALWLALARELAQAGRSIGEGKSWQTQTIFLPAIAVLLAASVIASYAAFQLPYDLPVSEHRALVERGPFLGLWVTPEQREILLETESRLRELEGRCHTLLALDSHPFVYLMTRMRPLTPVVVFGMLPGTIGEVERYFRSRALPEVIVEPLPPRQEEISRGRLSNYSHLPLVEPLFPGYRMEGEIHGLFAVKSRCP